MTTSGNWVVWLELEAFYRPHEQKLMAELRRVASREELELVHTLKATFDGELLR